MGMKIPSHQLSAFIEVAKCKSFSLAAESLGVTQSALSQRIAHLESDLESTLFIREQSGALLTASGEMLLRYSQTAQSLEEEVLHQLKSSASTYAGTFRVAGFSSVMRSVIIPALAPFLRENPEVVCEFKQYEVIELFDVLKSGKADAIVLDYLLEKKGIIKHSLGEEEYVVIESAKYVSPKDLYLDHGPQDNATEEYFLQQPLRPKKMRRSFMGDVYGIIDGVEEGLGRAVMSKHLLKSHNHIKIAKGYKRYSRPVTLNYFERPYYSALHKVMVDQLCKKCRIFL
jgi:DNA-binding transcriptional LysR family regulator